MSLVHHLIRSEFRSDSQFYILILMILVCKVHSFIISHINVYTTLETHILSSSIFRSCRTIALQLLIQKWNIYKTKNKLFTGIHSKTTTTNVIQSSCAQYCQFDFVFASFRFVLIFVHSLVSFAFVTVAYSSSRMSTRLTKFFFLFVSLILFFIAHLFAWFVNSDGRKRITNAHNLHSKWT